MNIQSFSTDVAKDYAGGNTVFDPALILTIAEMVVAIIAMFKDCKKTPAEAAAVAKSPSRWQRLVVNSAVRRHMGFREFRRDGDRVVSALLKNGGKLNEAEAKALFDEYDETDF